VGLRSKKFPVYLCILVFPLVFFVFQPQHLTSLQLNTVHAVSWPIRLAIFPFIELRKILLYHHTDRQYQKLKIEADTLRARMIGTEEVLRENSRLEKFLEFKDTAVFSSSAANVIGRDPTNWDAMIMIDKGSADGIKTGMPVVNALGVVGKIVETSAHTSRVQLLIDPDFSVAGLVQRTRDTGVISGTLNGICRLKYLSDGSKIHAGDRVVTSKLSSRFPAGLYLGDVIAVQTSQSAPTVECLIKPAVSFSQIEEVLVIHM
jgi:rod shape-determining protein MreC